MVVMIIKPATSRASAGAARVLEHACLAGGAGSDRRRAADTPPEGAEGVPMVEQTLNSSADIRQQQAH